MKSRALVWPSICFLWSLATVAQEPPIYLEESQATGLDFVHFNGMTGSLYIAETMGSGCALFDFDGDGDLDVFLVQGQLLGPDKKLEDAVFPPKSPVPLMDRLYRNDLKVLADGSRQIKFTDVTESSGIRAYGYGMGVTIGDYDSDGWLDLYITNYGPNQLWRNKGDGTFEDVTRATASDDPNWSVAAIFLDYNNDGHLDLFVSNYIQFDFKNHRKCPTKSGSDGYCGPSVYPDAPDRLLKNLGNGRFEDVTARAKINAFGSGLGVVAFDFNQDHFLDIYVANDADPNIMWINQGDGTFQDEALFLGCAVNAKGAAEASMGIEVEDYDGDGDLDLFVTHLSTETHTLYNNQNNRFFEDQTLQAGIGPRTRSATGFGTGWTDYDNDGNLDLFIANGNVYAIEALQRQKDPYPVHQPNQLFRNLGQGKLEEVSASAGPVFKLSEVSRGAAFGDIDNDGDADILVSNNSGPVRLLINQLGQENNWIGIKLLDTSKKFDQIDTLVGIGDEGGKRLWRRVRRTSSYASSQDPRCLFGLAKNTNKVRVEARYLDGSNEVWSQLQPNQYHVLTRGSGIREP